MFYNKCVLSIVCLALYDLCVFAVGQCLLALAEEEEEQEDQAEKEEGGAGNTMGALPLAN